MIRRMGSVSSNGKVETYSKECIRMMKGKVMERCTGLMEVITKVNGDKVSSMAWEK